MRRRILSVLALTTLAMAALILPSAVSAGSVATDQRIMLVQKHRFGSTNGTFVLYALTEGPLQLDSGTYVLGAREKPHIVRKGQSIAVYKAFETLTGKQGTFTIRWRVELVGAGEGSTVGTGSWSLFRGTGAYARASGSGRFAVVVMTPRGLTSSQFEGFIRVRR